VSSGSGSAGALEVELGPYAQADDKQANAFVVNHGHLAEAPASLAAVEQRLERTVGQVSGYALVLEHPDGDGVCARGERGVGARRDLHRGHVTSGARGPRLG
jgi:hypothetical protein